MKFADSMPLPRLRLERQLRAAVTLTICWLAAATLWAGGPRWVTGLPYFNQDGVPVVWYTNQPLYFTDPGDLSASVNHAAADAIVNAAAAVWSVPTSSLVLSYGGPLSEHVNGANTYLGSSGIVFPADVQSSNYLAKQIAVVYDSDGSITDLLLGNGASDPTSCRQNAVTESVDSIVPAGFIQHAVLVLNGRCTGPAPEQQLQMQYQLMRAFGRVLGLGWSQTNDNVFTGNPQPTFNQALNWPVMHPIDIICGPYTYQCMPEPFTLRADDLSALAALYFISQGQAPPGKTDSLYEANLLYGRLTFPNTQGMEGVNVVARRWEQYTDATAAEDWYTVSSVSGVRFRGSNGNPIGGVDSSMAGSIGSTGGDDEGYYELTRIPMLPGDWQNVWLETEPINPLYTGQYAVGPFVANTIEPSGSSTPLLAYVLPSYRISESDLFTDSTASSCDSGADGTEAAPVVFAPQGWNAGVLCGYGHTAWWSLTTKGNRTFTMEVTAQDEQGFASALKMMPVVGVWNASDPSNLLPTVAAATEAFNSESSGMTALTVESAQPSQLRIAIADQRGDGRPDFAYQSRVLYADSVVPASVSSLGGTITITGMGFRAGNAVTVNGVAAMVSSWSPTMIVATAPSLRTLGVNTALTADVGVTDLSTGGTTVMSGALTYAAPAPTLSLISAPSGVVAAGQAAQVLFTVQALAADGVTPLVGQAVVFSASVGTVGFSACGAATCTVFTDASGKASTGVTALGVGAVTLSAVGMAGAVSASFVAVTEVRTVTAAPVVEYVAAGATVQWGVQVLLTDNVSSSAGVMVDWAQVSGSVGVTPGESLADGSGVARALVSAGPVTGGAQAVVSACAWVTVCADLSTQGIDLAELRLVVVSGAGQVVGAGGTLAPVVLQVTDLAGHGVAGAVVEVHQTVDGWEMDCPDRGRCPVAPVYGASVGSVTSDAGGLVTVGPQQLVGTAEVTNIAAAVGTQGFVSMSLEKQP